MWKLNKYFSYTQFANGCLKIYFSGWGLRPFQLDLGDGTIMYCLVPKKRDPARPDLVLIHGFGLNAMWQFGPSLPYLARQFNLYIPDLLFFGESITTRPDRSAGFQARCVKRVLEANSVGKMAVLGASYGGFVAYSLAEQFPGSVESVVLCCAGVCLEDDDLSSGRFLATSVEGAAAILMPQTVKNLRETISYVFRSEVLKMLPACWLEDFIDEMCVQHVKEKTELLHAIADGKKVSDLPKISQPTLIMWGDDDQVFPMELGRRLKTHLGENADMIVFKNSGHAFAMERPWIFQRHLKKFLLKHSNKSTNASLVEDLAI